MAEQVFAGDGPGGSRVFLTTARDVAHQYPRWIGMALRMLRPDLQLPWAAKFCRDQGISAQELTEAVGAYARMMATFTSYTQGGNIDECRKNSGYDQVRQEIQVLIAAQVGLITEGAFLHGLRECTFENEPSAVMDKYLAFEQVVQEILAAFNKSPTA